MSVPTIPQRVNRATFHWLAWFPLAALTFGGSISQRSAMAESPNATTEIAPIDVTDFPALTEPPCSYCSTQNSKGMIADQDRVLAWIRAAHNGGAFPLRHFIAGPRVINDTYGLFFYDPEGGYTSAFEKDYGYQFVGRRNGVMVVKGRDGTLWSALTGVAISGPQAGTRLTRIPSFVTDWGYWMMLHPESTAYDLFDGKRYPIVDLPTIETGPASNETIDGRLPANTPVMGVEFTRQRKAYRLDGLAQRACYQDQVDGTPIAVFWYGPTRSSVVFDRRVNGRTLSFYADEISPESAPFKDRETGTRWTLAGRAIDGPLRGTELTWVPSVQCHWYAWISEYPKSGLHAEAAQQVDP